MQYVQINPTVTRPITHEELERYFVARDERRQTRRAAFDALRRRRGRAGRTAAVMVARAT